LQIRNPLNGLVKTPSVLKENTICFCQSSTLFGCQITLTSGDLTPGEKHVQMLHAAHVREANIYIIGCDQFVIVRHASTSLESPSNSKTDLLR